MSGHAILGITVGKSQVAVEGRPANDEFGLAGALYTLLQQASENSDLAEGGLEGAVVGEPRLQRRMSYQSENLSMTAGGRLHVHPR